MGAGQSDLYKGTYGDQLENIPDELKDSSDSNDMQKDEGKTVSFPNDNSQTKHIFRKAKGHIPDTPKNRKMLEDLANDKGKYLGTDSWGKDWHAETNPDGSQKWVCHRTGTIQDGGVNSIPREFNPRSGMNIDPFL